MNGVWFSLQHKQKQKLKHNSREEVHLLIIIQRARVRYEMADSTRLVDNNLISNERE